MNPSKSLFKRAILLLALLITQTSYARIVYVIGIPPWMQRENWAYGYIASSAVYKGTVMNTNGEIVQQETKQTVKSKGGISYTAGTYFPITRLGRNSSLALSINSGANILIWDNIAGGMLEDDFGLNFGGTTAEAILPIGADFMFGCDALQTKSKRLSATLGAGIMPMYAMTSFEDNQGMQFMARPYVKAEAGIFLGICMKLRLMCALGPINYINSSNSTFKMGDYSSNFTFTGQSSVSISLMVLPFSYMWEETGWWNDTY